MIDDFFNVVLIAVCFFLIVIGCVLASVSVWLILNIVLGA